ncbi:Succinate dehydrogenase subunit 6, mitochondrial [Linum perenne]
MADTSKSFLSRQWEEYKGFWAERFSFLDNYSRFINRDKPLPSWSSDDVQEFIASDPHHGPVLKTAREAVSFGLTGSLLGAVSTAAFTWKYSRSLHGAGLSFVAGGAFGWTFGHELANHWYQLYRMDTMAAQVKFMEWWEKKSEGRS